MVKRDRESSTEGTIIHEQRMSKATNLPSGGQSPSTQNPTPITAFISAPIHAPIQAPTAAVEPVATIATTAVTSATTAPAAIAVPAQMDSQDVLNGIFVYQQWVFDFADYPCGRNSARTFQHPRELFGHRPHDS